MADLDVVDAGDLLRGLEAAPLPEGALVVGFVALLKVMDADGDTGWYTRADKDTSEVEVLGAVNAARLLSEQRLIDLYEDDTD